MLDTHANRTRAARLLLAALDDDPPALTAVMDEAHATEAGLPGLVAALAEGFLELIVGTAGEDGARKTLNLALLDASFGGDHA